MRAATKSCASLPTTRSIDGSSLGEPPHRVKRGKPKMGAASTLRHNPRPDIRKPLRIPNHPFVGAKYFSPRRRPSVARNRLTISAVHHLLHGRNIFRPDVGNWWRVAPWSFKPHITFCTGEKYFAPTCAIVTLPPDRRHRMFQSSIFSRTSSHPQPSICRGEIFFARTSAIGGAQPPVCFCRTSPFARAKYFSPLHVPLLPRRKIATPAAAHHQYVRKPLRISNRPFVGAKYFSPGRRPLVAPNTLVISAPNHL